MKELVLCHPAKEIGGNLFGLWNDNGEPVLHILLGPAIGCTRTEVSIKAFLIWSELGELSPEIISCATSGNGILTIACDCLSQVRVIRRPLFETSPEERVVFSSLLLTFSRHLVQ